MCTQQTWKKNEVSVGNQVRRFTGNAFNVARMSRKRKRRPSLERKKYKKVGAEKDVAKEGSLDLCS